MMAGSVFPAVLSFLKSKIFPEHLLCAGYRELNGGMTRGGPCPTGINSLGERWAWKETILIQWQEIYRGCSGEATAQVSRGQRKIPGGNMTKLRLEG